MIYTNLISQVANPTQEESRSINKLFFFELTCSKVFGISVNQSNASFLLVSQSSAIFQVSYQKEKLGCLRPGLFFMMWLLGLSIIWHLIYFVRIMQMTKLSIIIIVQILTLIFEISSLATCKYKGKKKINFFAKYTIYIITYTASKNS